MPVRSRVPCPMWGKQLNNIVSVLLSRRPRTRTLLVFIGCLLDSICNANETFFSSFKHLSFLPQCDTGKGESNGCEGGMKERVRKG